jgi:predicted nucleotidyltransferase
LAAVRSALADAIRAGAIEGAWIIGSSVWGGFGERSDVDVVVRGLDVARRNEFADALATRAGVAVDLLRWEELDATFRARIEADGERVP